MIILYRAAHSNCSSLIHLRSLKYYYYNLPLSELSIHFSKYMYFYHEDILMVTEEEDYI